MNTKQGIFLAMFGLLVFCAFIGTASGATIYVPDDYTKIQWAVDNATAGDLLIVRDGTYTENIDVDKRLTIRSENGSSNCIVQAADSYDHAFEVTGDYVVICGFTATGSYRAGIYLTSDTVHCTISNNAVLNNNDGIYLYSSSSNMITNNKVSNNDDGIYLSHSSNNMITNNNASSNSYYGNHLYSSYSSNMIMNNTASNNKNGIYLRYHSSSNMIMNNTVNSNNDNGIYLRDSSNNTIMNNIISNNNYGVRSYDLSISVPTNNIIANNNYGIYLGDTGENAIKNNIVSNNTQYGFYLYESNNNKIYLKNFINNSDSVYSYKSNNIWNSISKINYSYKGRTYTNYTGNYWDSYTGSDANSDGIGDTPYSIDSDKDNYPLMERFESYWIYPIPEPEMKLKIEPGGKDKLRVNFTTNLDDEFRVDLKVVDPHGCMLSVNPANDSQGFRNITVATLKDMLIDIGGDWCYGIYTFWVRTNRGYAPELDARSNPDIFEITDPRIYIDASKLDPCINETIFIKVRATPYHNISIESSYPIQNSV